MKTKYTFSYGRPVGYFML